MALKLITISDGFESSSVPAINLPTVERVQTLHYILTASDIFLGYVILPTVTLFPAETVLLWEGINQEYGVDFTVLGNQVFFLSELLPTLLAGDTITIIFS